MSARCKVTFVVNPRVLDLVDGIADERGVGTSRLVESILIHFLRYELERRNRVNEAVPVALVREREQIVELLPSPIELDGSKPSIFNRRAPRRQQKRV